MRFSKFLLESEDDEKIIQILRNDCRPFLNEKALLYRGISNFNKFKIKKMRVEKNRLPANMPKVVHELLDDGFNSLFGFKARSQSVFCTGSFIEAKKYGDVYNIFPIGNFKYCWSKDIEDIYNTDNWFLYKTANTESEKRVLDLSVLFLYFNSDWYELRESFLQNFEYFKNHFNFESWNNLSDFIDTMDTNKEFRKQIDSFSKYAKKRNVGTYWIKFHRYTDKDLSDAMFKNGEIMINCNEYYLVDSEFVEKNHQRIYSK